MNLKQALNRIEELERRLRELEARPQQVHHYYYYSIPTLTPQPYYPQINPNNPWIVACDNQTQ